MTLWGRIRLGLHEPCRPARCPIATPSNRSSPRHDELRGRRTARLHADQRRAQDRRPKRHRHLERRLVRDAPDDNLGGLLSKDQPTPCVQPRGWALRRPAADPGCCLQPERRASLQPGCVLRAHDCNPQLYVRRVGLHGLGQSPERKCDVRGADLRRRKHRCRYGRPHTARNVVCGSSADQHPRPQHRSCDMALRAQRRQLGARRLDWVQERKRQSMRADGYHRDSPIEPGGRSDG